MSQITGLPPFGPEPLTAAQREAAKPTQEGFGGAFVDAAYSDWSLSWAARQLARVGTNLAAPYDPNFKVDDDLVKRLGDGLSDEQKSHLWGARTYDEATLMRDQFVGVNEARRRESGHTAAQLLAGFTDPVYIAAGIATGGAAEAVAPMLGAGRVARLAANGIIATTLNIAPIEAYRASQDPEADFTQSMIHGSLGVLGFEGLRLGAGFGGRYTGAFIKALGEDRKAIELNEAVGTVKVGAAMGAAGGTEFSPEMQAILSRMRITDAAKEMIGKKLMGEEAAKYFAGALQTDPVEYVNKLAQHIGLEEEFHGPEIQAMRDNANDLYNMRFNTPRPEVPMPIDAAPGQVISDPAHREGVDVALFGPKNKPEKAPPLGPIEPPPKPRAVRVGDFFPTQSDDMSARGKLLTIVGTVGRSDSPLARRVINNVLTDPLAKITEAGKKAASTVALDEWGRREIANRWASFLGVYKPEFEQWFRDQGFKSSERQLAEEQFGALLVNAHQRLPGEFTKDVHVNKVVDHVRGQLKDQLDFMHNHFVQGTENIPTDGTYYPNRFKASLVAAADSKYGANDVDRLFGEAFNEEPGKVLNPEDRSQLGHYYAMAIRNSDRIQIRRAGGPSENIIEHMAEKMRSDKIPEHRIRDLLYEAREEGAEKGPVILHRRANLDRNFSLELANKDTGALETVRIADLIDQDYRNVIASYLDSTTRLSGMAKTLHELGQPLGMVNGFTSFDELRGHVMAESQNLGMSKMAVEMQDRKLDAAYKRVMGQPLNEKTAFGQALAVIRNYNHAVMSGWFGVAQLPQVGSVMAINGVRSFAENMPKLAEMLANARDGNLAETDLRIIQRISAADFDQSSQDLIRRLDDSATSWDKIQRGSQNLANFASRLSGLGFITRNIRQAAAMQMLDRFTEIALSGKMPNEARLGQWGMTREWAEKAAAALRDDKQSHWMLGEAGTKIRMPDLDKWDPETASRFVGAIDKGSKLSVHDSTFGSQAAWMQTDIGKTMMQFLTFHHQAWEKQLLSRIQANDFEAWSGAAHATLIGALAYMAQQYVKAATMPADKRAEFLKDRLSYENLGAAAFARSGVTSMLPQFYDSASHFTGGKPAFANSRYSDLGSDLFLWQNNPTGRELDALLNHALPRALGPIREQLPEGTIARKLLGPAPSDADVNRKSAEIWTSLAPMRKTIGFQQMYDLFQNQFPEPRRR